ncbi:hypothetical protein KFE25_005431 [Diacronema lutheri]|uniref:Uncharacterized protein n=1 Tax=Diacronema lutheri TaxID=2081491 RepID=A0A8J6CC95_DIALT|nr:hypothetical protein KFE25_005431 [Diacronema lutheri]
MDAPLLDASDMSRLAGVVAVSGVFFYMYYAFMQLGPSARMSNKSEAQVQWGSRAFGNLHEQAPTFLLALWSHALFVSPDSAAALGAAWLVFRAAYPILWMLGHGFTPKILFSTIPMYGICLYMMAATVCSACLGKSLVRAFLGSHTLGCVVGSLAFYAHFQLLGTVNERVKAFFTRAPAGGRKI